MLQKIKKLFRKETLILSIVPKIHELGTTFFKGTQDPQFSQAKAEVIANTFTRMKSEFNAEDKTAFGQLQFDLLATVTNMAKTDNFETIDQLLKEKPLSFQSATIIIVFVGTLLSKVAAAAGIPPEGFFGLLGATVLAPKKKKDMWDDLEEQLNSPDDGPVN